MTVPNLMSKAFFSQGLGSGGGGALCATPPPTDHDQTKIPRGR